MLSMVGVVGCIVCGDSIISRKKGVKWGMVLWPQLLQFRCWDFKHADNPLRSRGGLGPAGRLKILRSCCLLPGDVNYSWVCGGLEMIYGDRRSGFVLLSLSVVCCGGEC